MEGAAVFRLIALIPDRAPRAQTGSLFAADGTPRMDLLCRFLNWLGPLSAATREEQQLLGVRSAAVRPLGEGEPGESDDLSDEAEETPVRPMEAGTQIAA